MKKIISTTLIYLFLSFTVSAAETPKFFGVYTLSKGEYIEIPRVKIVSQAKDHYSLLRAQTTHLVPKKSFIEINVTDFNKEGFIVVGEDVANETIKFPKLNGEFLGNSFHKVKSIYTDLIDHQYVHPGQGAGMRNGPKLRKAKIADNTYAYLPREPLSPGYYVLDYTTLGKQPEGNWNVFKLIGNEKPEIKAERVPLISIFSGSEWMVDNKKDNKPAYTLYLRKGGQIEYYSNKKKKVIKAGTSTWKIENNQLILAWQHGDVETFDVSTSQFDEYHGRGKDGRKWVITRWGL